MKNFTKQVLAVNSATVPMVESHFHKWLTDGPKPSSRQMVTIPLYLATFGYEKGRDGISSQAIKTLGYIHTNWWMIRIKARPVSHPVGYYSLIENGD
jgi:hypothetical protein